MHAYFFVFRGCAKKGEQTKMSAADKSAEASKNMNEAATIAAGNIQDQAHKAAVAVGISKPTFSEKVSDAAHSAGDAATIAAKNVKEAASKK
jgi:hypothetical protein